MAHWLATSRGFSVCGTCYELRGPFRWRFNGHRYDHIQECTCARDRRADGERPDTWPGFDFNTVAELCQACGCEVLQSGSRFSVWFCHECKPRAVALNVEVGQPLVPIGRHTLMHGIGLPAQPKPTLAEIDTFVTRFGNLATRINRLRDWAHSVVHSNLSTIGRSAMIRVPLAEYVEALRTPDRARYFAQMVTATLD